MTAREVATWANKARVALVRRDEAIHRMRAEGATLQAIATAAGMTHPGIMKILERTETDDPRPTSAAQREAGR